MSEFSLCLYIKYVSLDSTKSFNDVCRPKFTFKISRLLLEWFKSQGVMLSPMFLAHISRFWSG